MKYKNLTLNVEGFSDLTKDFQALIDLIPSIPELDKLIVEATKNGPITVDFVSLAELDTTGVYKEKGNQEFLNGRVVKQTIKRKIKVAEEGKSFKDILDTLIFELCNAKNPYFQMYSPESVSPEKYEDREAYATATEYAEYLCTHLPAKEITKAVFSNQKYLEALKQKGIVFTKDEIHNLTNDFFASFDDWWHHTNHWIKGKNYSHSDTYRRQFDAKRGKGGKPTKPAPMIMPLAPNLPTPSQQPVPGKPVVPSLAPVKETTNPVKPVEALSKENKATVNPLMQELMGRLTKRQDQPTQAPKVLPTSTALKKEEPAVKEQVAQGQVPTPKRPLPVIAPNTAVKKPLPAVSTNQDAKRPLPVVTPHAAAKTPVATAPATTKRPLPTISKQPVVQQQAPKTPVGQARPAKQPTPTVQAQPVKPVEKQGAPVKAQAQPVKPVQQQPVPVKEPANPAPQYVVVPWAQYTNGGEVNLVLPFNFNLKGGDQALQRIVDTCLSQANMQFLPGSVTIYLKKCVNEPHHQEFAAKMEYQCPKHRCRRGRC